MCSNLEIISIFPPVYIRAIYSVKDLKLISYRWSGLIKLEFNLPWFTGMIKFYRKFSHIILEISKQDWFLKIE
jgi:hypothetical protein